MPPPPRQPIALADIASAVGAQLLGDGRLPIRQIAPLARAQPGEIGFLASGRYRADLAATRASAVIVGPADAGATSLPRLVSPNPYACYARVAALLNPTPAPAPGVHPLACVDPTARVAPSASIGAFAAVGAGAEVGARVVIESGAAIGARVVIGEGSTVRANATIYDGCRLGRRVIVHAAAVIGSDGFGMADDGGVWIKIPQLGSVVIGDDVEVGAGTTIDRGALDDTVIEEGVKLDNQIQVGHNCRIGAHTAIAGCVGIAGSVRIGRHCRIGGAAMISGHLEIAERTVISGGTLVAASIRSPGVYTGVFPILPHGEWLHVGATLRQLRELAGRVRALERALADKGS